MDIHKIYLLFQKRFRPKRMGSFVQLFTVDSSTRVLDVGGTLLNWSFVKVKPQLTILNIHPPAEPMPPNVKWVVGDARCMPFVQIRS